MSNPRPTITICIDGTLADTGDQFPWFTRQGDQHEDNLLEIAGDYHTDDADLLATLDASGDFSSYHVELDRGDGSTTELR